MYDSTWGKRARTAWAPTRLFGTILLSRKADLPQNCLGEVNGNVNCNLATFGSSRYGAGGGTAIVPVVSGGT